MMKALLARTASAAPPSLSERGSYWADGPENGFTAGAVATWKDRSGNGWDLGQPTSTKQGVWSATSGPNGKGGITFDGVDDFMFTAGWGTLSQRLWVIAVCALNVKPGQQPSGFSGMVSGSSLLYNQGGDGPTMFAGSNGPTAFGATSTAIRAFHCDFNGASSKMTINGGTALTGNPGAGTMTGLIIGAYGSGPIAGFFNPGPYSYIAVGSGDPTAHANWTAFKAWVLSTYVLTLT